MAAIEETANNGGEKKIVVKDERKGGKGDGRGYFIPRHSGRGNSGKSPKKEKFQGACTNLIGHVFEAGANRSAQIAAYTTSMEAIKNFVGINYDPNVLQSIEETEDITPEEPELVTPPEPNKVRGEEIKYGKKLDRHLSKIDFDQSQMAVDATSERIVHVPHCTETIVVFGNRLIFSLYDFCEVIDGIPHSDDGFVGSGVAKMYALEYLQHYDQVFSLFCTLSFFMLGEAMFSVIIHLSHEEREDLLHLCLNLVNFR